MNRSMQRTCWNCGRRYTYLKTNWKKPCPKCGKSPEVRVMGETPVPNAPSVSMDRGGVATASGADPSPSPDPAVSLEQRIAVCVAEWQEWFASMDAHRSMPNWSPAIGLLSEAADTLAAQREALTQLREALEVIHKTTRGDEHSECWTIRKWLDERGVFNDDIQGAKRLVEACCTFALATSPKEAR